MQDTRMVRPFAASGSSAVMLDDPGLDFGELTLAARTGLGKDVSRLLGEPTSTSSLGPVVPQGAGELEASVGQLLGLSVARFAQPNGSFCVSLSGVVVPLRQRRLGQAHEREHELGMVDAEGLFPDP